MDATYLEEKEVILRLLGLLPAEAEAEDMLQAKIQSWTEDLEEAEDVILTDAEFQVKVVTEVAENGQIFTLVEEEEEEEQSDAQLIMMVEHAEE